jgi:chemotaxis protein CheC
VSTKNTGGAPIVQIENLAAIQLDALREIGNIGAGNAATSLSQMVGHRIGMTVPSVRALPLDEVPAAVAGSDDALVVAIYLRVLGDAPGHIMFAMTVEDAKSIATSVLSGMAAGEPDASGLGDMERSALQEVGNILTSAYLIAMTTFTGLHLEPSPPDLGVDMAAALVGQVLSEVALTGDVALVIETAFEELDQPVAGSFLYIPTPEGLAKVLAGLGVAS